MWWWWGWSGLDADAADELVFLDVGGLEGPAVEGDVAEGDAVDGVLGAEADEFDEEGVAGGVDVGEGDVADVSALGVAGPEGLADPEGGEALGILDADIFEADAGDGGGVAVEDAEGPFAAFVVDDVAVAEDDVGDVVADFGADGEGVGDFVPEGAAFDADALGGSVALVGFDDDEVVEGAEEAVLDEDIAAVADVDAVGVGAVADDFDVADADVAGAADGEGPGGGVAEDDAFDVDVGGVGDEDQFAGVGGAGGAVEDAAAADADVAALEGEGGLVVFALGAWVEVEGFVVGDGGLEEGAGGEVEGGVVGDQAVVEEVAAGGEVEGVGVVGVGRIDFGGVSEEVEGLDPAVVDFDGDGGGLLELEAEGVAVDVGLEAEGGGEQAGLADGFGEGDGDVDRLGHVEGGEGGVVEVGVGVFEVVHGLPAALGVGGGDAGDEDGAVLAVDGDGVEGGERLAGGCGVDGEVVVGGGEGVGGCGEGQQRGEQAGGEGGGGHGVGG